MAHKKQLKDALDKWKETADKRMIKDDLSKNLGCPKVIVKNISSN